MKLSTDAISIIATIVVATIGIAALIIDGHGAAREERASIRDEARADRAAFEKHIESLRAADQADRAAFEKHVESLRAADRADREAWQAEMRALREDAAAGREDVSRLTGIVEQMRTAER